MFVCHQNTTNLLRFLPRLIHHISASKSSYLNSVSSNKVLKQLCVDADRAMYLVYDLTFSVTTSSSGRQKWTTKIISHQLKWATWHCQISHLRPVGHWLLLHALPTYMYKYVEWNTFVWMVYRLIKCMTD